MDLKKINEERKRRGKKPLTQDEAIRYARTSSDNDIEMWLIGYQVYGDSTASSYTPSADTATSCTPVDTSSCSVDTSSCSVDTGSVGGCDGTSF